MSATDRTEYPAPATRLDRGSFRRLARCGGAPIGMLFALALAGCDEKAQSQAAAPPPPPVTVAQPVKRTVTDWDEFTGRFEAIQEVQVRARVGGFVNSVEFKDGAIVRAGDLLYIIDPRPFEAVALQAEGQLADARAKGELAKRDLERGLNLVQTSAVSEQVVDQRRQALQAARAAETQAEGALKAAQLNVEFTHVVAPITGRVSRHLVTPGNLVQGSEGGATLLTSIVSLDPIYIYFDVDEATYQRNSRLWFEGKRPSSRDTPNPVQVTLTGETKPSHEGKMDFLDNRLDVSTATLRSRAIIPNKDLSILPGQFGRVRIIGSSPYEALLIPDTAVATDQSRKIVFVVKEDNTVEARPVVLGPLDEGLRVIREGLKAEDHVIVDGLQRARVGAKVTPKMAQAPAGDKPAGVAGRCQAMNLGRLSINQPILAMVLSIVLLIVGAIAYPTLPVSEYPQVVPPTVTVTTQYPGASAQTVSDTVAAPIEQEINGVEDMLYLYSQATSNGQLTITVTFKLGTDLDKAQVLVQNRVAIAQPRLPEEVQRNGVVTRKNSPDILMVVFVLSPDDTFDQLYISNYALLQVRDELLRLDGVGDIQMFGARDYSMRLWLDPDRIANLGLTSSEVLAAIRAQNLQIAGGQIAEPPIADRAFQPNLVFTGRLKDIRQFEDIVVKAGSDGRTVRLRDVARVELGALSYTTSSFLLRKSAVAMVVTQRPGSNALATAKQISDTMAQLKTSFPKGLDYNIGYNPTEFIAQSVHELIKTIYEAMALVVIVVLVFLQGWRPAIIPIIAIPVSLVGTFAVMAALGFSINNLTLFGLVLAVGIVVDDAIVVVENVERHLQLGMSRREAALKTMEEVGGALVSIALVLCAVFVPTAFLGGISGQFFRQFAVTIAVATAISCFCSLTLSPALASLILTAARGETAAGALEHHRARLGQLHRAVQPRLRSPGARLRGRRRLRDPAYGGDACDLSRADRQRRLAARHHLAGLHPGAGSRLRHHLGAIARRRVAGADHCGGARNRADRAGYAGYRPCRRLRRLLRRDAHAGRQRRGAVPGVRRAGGAAEEGIVGERHHGRAAQAAVGDPGRVHHRHSAAGGAGHRHRRRLRHAAPGSQGRGPELLAAATDELVAAARKSPRLTSVFSPFTANTPQLFVDIDRIQAQKLGVPIANVTDTIETYFGSTYVNDFNLFGRTYRVTAQADLPFRKETADLARLRTRNAAGDMVLLGSVMDFKRHLGTRPRAALQSLSGVRNAGRAGTGRELDDGARHHGAARRRDAAERLLLRMDRSVLPADDRRQCRPLCLPDLRAVRLPGAGGAIWQLDPAVRGDPDRADVPVRRHPRRAHHGAGRQHPDPDRLRRAGRAWRRRTPS